MIIDLFEMWKGPLIKKQASLVPEKIESYSDGVMASTFDLPENVKIVFIADKKKFTPVFNYEELPEVRLTEEEQEIVHQTAEEIFKQKPPFNYDGDHILLSGVLYDTEKNTLFIEAKKAKYSLLTGLTRKKFAKESPIWEQDLYGAGAVVPLITKDGNTVLLQSNKFNNFLTVAGFVQAKEPSTKLMDESTGLSLIEQTAKEELMEELLADEDLQPRIDVDKFSVSTVSFRKPQGGRGFVEFFIGAELNCKLAQLERVIQTNVAPDHNEHSGKYVPIDLNSENRGDVYEKWSKVSPGGRDLYPTTVRVASRLFNKSYYGDQTQQFMPVARIESFPISFFKPVLRRSLKDNSEPQDNKVMTI